MEWLKLIKTPLKILGCILITPMIVRGGGQINKLNLTNDNSTNLSNKCSIPQSSNQQKLLYVTKQFTVRYI